LKIFVSPLAYREAPEYPKVQRIIHEFVKVADAPVFVILLEITGTRNWKFTLPQFTPLGITICMGCPIPMIFQLSSY
jgi:hypothetical protein